MGGLIAPGLALFTDYLKEKTALLPKIELTQLNSGARLGVSTAESMMLACEVGFVGMIRALCQRAELELKGRGITHYTKICTGPSTRILHDLIGDWENIPHLQLFGLAEAWRRQWM